MLRTRPAPPLPPPPGSSLHVSLTTGYTRRTHARAHTHIRVKGELAAEATASPCLPPSERNSSTAGVARSLARGRERSRRVGQASSPQSPSFRVLLPFAGIFFFVLIFFPLLPAGWSTSNDSAWHAPHVASRLPACHRLLLLRAAVMVPCPV